jgi:hypothetical protein
MATQNANSVAITGGTINNTVIGGTTPAASTFTTLTSTGQANLGGVAGSESLIVNAVSGSTRWIEIAGSASGNTSIRTRGAGNPSFQLVNRGTGPITFSTADTLSNIQAQVSNTASAVNYVQVTGSVTGGSSVISAQGSDTQQILTVLGRGTNGGVSLGSSASTYFRALGYSGVTAVNYFQVQGTGASNAPVLSAQGSDTNIAQVFQSKGTGSLQFQTNAGAQEQFRITHTASAVNYVELTGAPTNNAPTIGSRGSDTNINFAYSSKGTGGHDFYTAGTSFARQFTIANTASAVNFVQVTGAATAAIPTISAQGSDTNASLQLQGKGNGEIRLASQRTNFLIVSGSASSVGNVTFTASGGDTNIDLTLTPKGTGNVRFGTFTGTILTPTGYVEIKDSGGTVRRLLVG